MVHASEPIFPILWFFMHNKRQFPKCFVCVSASTATCITFCSLSFVPTGTWRNRARVLGARKISDRENLKVQCNRNVQMSLNPAFLHEHAWAPTLSMFQLTPPIMHSQCTLSARPKCLYHFSRSTVHGAHPKKKIFQFFFFKFGVCTVHRGASKMVKTLRQKRRVRSSRYA